MAPGTLGGVATDPDADVPRFGYSASSAPDGRVASAAKLQRKALLSGLNVHALGSSGGRYGSGAQLPALLVVDETVGDVNSARNLSRP